MEANTSYIPVLARIKFQLQILKIVETSLELTEVKVKLDENIATFQQMLKIHIIACAKLEATSLLCKENKLYCKAVYNTAIMFHKAHASHITPTAMREKRTVSHFFLALKGRRITRIQLLLSIDVE